MAYRTQQETITIKQLTTLIQCDMAAYREFCLYFWKATKDLNLYSMDGHQLDKLITDAFAKTKSYNLLFKKTTKEISVLIKAINQNIKTNKNS